MGQSYRDLIIWQKAMVFVREVYRATVSFPKEETYGLTSQLRRAAVSIPSNIAEGQGRFFKREFSQFIGHAMGSLMEVETQILIAVDLHYLTPEQGEKLLGQAAEIGRLANGLVNSLRKSASGSA